MADLIHTLLQMLALRRNVLAGQSSGQQAYHRMGDSGRASGGADSAAYAVKGFLRAFLEIASLRIGNILHNI